MSGNSGAWLNHLKTSISTQVPSMEQIMGVDPHFKSDFFFFLIPWAA